MTTETIVPLEPGAALAPALEQQYEYPETRELVTLVSDAAELVRTRGEAAFAELQMSGSRWRHGERYVFVLDPEGNMLVHPDPALENRNELNLRDINGKPIIRGLIEAATALPERQEGWYHYQWPVPHGLLPRWKSSYVRLVVAPTGKRYIVGSGVYNDRMERVFVVDAVSRAAAELERRGTAAFPLFRDPTGPFIVKDTYIFVTSMEGVELVNPAFPNLEGRSLLDLTDAHGKHLIREMLGVVEVDGVGWVEYMWPKPGESVATQKSTYVRKALMAGQPVLVGCGVYLAEAPQEVRPAPGMTASELMTLVREAAAVLAEQGEKAYPELRRGGSRWRRDDTYFFVWTMKGIRSLHAADPSMEGEDASDLKDVLGRPAGRMILEAGATEAGEGWVHYMYPRPGDIFPIWKSSFVKRVTFPSGIPHIVGSGVYNMRMEKAFIEAMVDRASALIAERGSEVFPLLRDRTGPFVFMDTYVFVHDTEGTELVNAALPSLEGRNLLDLRDLRGRAVIPEQIAAVRSAESAWLEGSWYKPGDNTPAKKQTYVRKVQWGGKTWIVGSGIYTDSEPKPDGE